MVARKIYIDTDRRAFVVGQSGIAALKQTFSNEDVENVELYFLARDAAGTLTAQDYSANTVKFAVGTTTPAVLGVTWAAISTTVTASVSTLVTGGSGSNEQQKITLSPQPTEGAFSIQLPARSVTVSTVSANVFTAADHGLYDGQSVTLTAFSFTNSSVVNGSAYFVIRGGKDEFSLASIAGSVTALTAEVTSGGGTVDVGAVTTGQVAFDATPAEVELALRNSGLAVLDRPQIIVTGTAGKEYTLTYANGSANRDYDPVTIVGSTLAAAPGLQANVNFNTVSVADLLAAGTTSVTMEVEVSDGTLRHSYRTQATLSSDLISSSSPLTLTTSSFTLNSGDGSTWNITIDNNGSLTAAKV